MRTLFQTMSILSALCAVASAPAAESHLMRGADVHDDQIVFTYEGDLWLVAAAGGDARRITNHEGAEYFAKFSPDGTQIAFTAEYDGGTDVYVMDARGGVPERLTYHPAADHVLDWYPDGKWVLFRSRREYPFRGEQLYRVSVDGGMPERLPVDRAGLASLSPDARRIAYNRITREHRTWKRHQGGTAQDIWVGSLEAADFHKITDWPGTDNFPMWHGDAIYFTSDRQYGTLNIFLYDTNSGQTAPLTAYEDYDVKYPSIGPKHIVYQYAESLHLLELASGTVRQVPVHIPTDLVRMRPTYEPVSGDARTFNLSPSGKRALLEMRGEIVNLPAEKGDPINLTRTLGTREKNPAWSPDGKWIALISDRTGEEEVYLVDQKGAQPWRQLSKEGIGWRMQLAWSPDSRYLLFSDKFMRLNLLEVEGGQITVIDQGEYDDGWERWGIQDYVWSADSRWIAYTKLEASLYESIFLYSMDSKQVTRVTSEMTEDFSPSFDPEGRYLYFLSNRTFEPIMGFVDQNHVFLDMCRPYLVILQEGQPSPFAPEDSQEEVAEATEAKEEEGQEAAESKTDDKDKDEAAEEDEKERKKPKEVKIDLAGLERRTVAVEGVPAGNYFRLEATDKGFLYLAKKDEQFLKYQTVNDETTDKLDLYSYDLKEKETTEVLPEISNYHISADGRKLVYRSGDTYGVVEVGKEAKVGDGKVELADVRVRVSRPEEFAQIFNEAWRVQRDWFYDPHMHQVDWAAIGEKYRRFVPFCGNRSDLNYLIGEMIGELNAGHTYVWGGDVEQGGPKIATGLLGAEFEAPPGSDYHRIAHIIPGSNADQKERSPLYAPDCPIKVGDYLIAIDGEPVASTDNVYRFLENKADKVVTITYNSEPTQDGAKTYRTKTIGSEEAIRYRQWVQKNAAFVAEATDGQVAYLHLPNMMEAGLIEFARAFFPLHYMRAIILDARYNGGGFTADMIIDRLERQLWAITQPREGKPIRDPERAFYGHLAVLINEDTGSNGEYFAEAIKRKGLATVIGMRTWGGAVGIEPHQRLIDGGTTTPPQFAPYGLERKWLIEGHGVDPDIEVQNMPGDVLHGRDAQLEKAIEVLLEKLEQDPRELPAPPPYPDKRKPIRTVAAR